MTFAGAARVQENVRSVCPQICRQDCGAGLHWENNWQLTAFLRMEQIAKVVTKMWTDLQQKTRKISVQYSKSHYMNFIVTQEMPVPKGIPEKFTEFGL